MSADAKLDVELIAARHLYEVEMYGRAQVLGGEVTDRLRIFEVSRGDNE